MVMAANFGDAVWCFDDEEDGTVAVYLYKWWNIAIVMAEMNENER